MTCDVSPVAMFYIEHFIFHRSRNFLSLIPATAMTSKQPGPRHRCLSLTFYSNIASHASHEFKNQSAFSSCYSCKILLGFHFTKSPSTLLIITATLINFKRRLCFFLSSLPLQLHDFTFILKGADPLFSKIVDIALLCSLQLFRNQRWPHIVCSSLSQPCFHFFFSLHFFSSSLFFSLSSRESFIFSSEEILLRRRLLDPKSLLSVRHPSLVQEFFCLGFLPRPFFFFLPPTSCHFCFFPDHWSVVNQKLENTRDIRVHQNIKKFSEFQSNLIYVVSIWKKTKNAFSSPGHHFVENALFTL